VPSSLPVENQTVLIVDDEEIVRKLAAGALKSSGMRAVVAGTGSEALAILRSQPSISVVILDLTMPLMTGEETLPLIKSIRPDIPVIISSGFSEKEIARRFAASGIAGVLPKPYTVSGIVSSVTSALNAWVRD
jgi:two-component system, cell cycle sensor histidine kinase and response regulator CckA